MQLDGCIVTDERGKPFVTDQLKEAYAVETDNEVKRELLKSLMIVNPSDGRAYIRELEPESDPELAADIENYLADKETGMEVQEEETE